ncbi:YdbC family protein [Candidatus Soleaferrea massiliensis]|uniref:YdbC family protein n=1 Tax=Candidatus Soleaferrea massiliensis TaxID=1470354 RepID=UPI00058E25C2|nr:YdbC family protein [Candidatus Soleaferrea massiliensis]
MAELTFEIVKEIGVLGTSARGWSKELNLVSWNGREAKYDLREWSPDHARMGKGITLSDEELANLKDILDKTNI